MSRKIIAVIAVVIMGFSNPAYADANRAFNRVVILLDNSGTYKSRINDAVNKSVSLLEKLGEKEVKRYDKMGGDQISVIALDSIPTEIWSGSLRELKSASKDEWTKRFRARTDFAGCTDVNGAFNMAIQLLNKEPAAANKYLLAFTDFIHEPPLENQPAQKINRCEKPSRAPTADFPWKGLEDVSVSAFWVPADQVNTWKRAIGQQGLTHIAMHSESESGTVGIKPPPQAKRTLSEADKERNKERYIGNTLHFINISVKTLAGLLLLIVALIWLYRRYQQYRGSRAANAQIVPITSASGHMPRRVNGPISPLNIHRPTNRNN